MGWFLRTSKNGVHAVYTQQAEESCGIACVIMVNFKLKKWSLVSSAMQAVSGGPISAPITVPIVASAINDTVKCEDEVDAAYSKVTGVPYRGTTYTYATVLPQVLNKLEIGHWVGVYVRANNLAGTILDHASASVPCVALVHWRRGGGHFVVCDNVVKNGRSGGTADFCDPWDGAVRTLSLQRGREVVYTVADQPAFDFGQTHYKYGAKKMGDMDGWIIYRSGG